MSKSEKLLLKLQAGPKPTDFTWKDAESVLVRCGFKEIKTSGGSGVKFYHADKDFIFRMHKPHNPPVLKAYQIDNLIDALKEVGCISDE